MKTYVLESLFNMVACLQIFNFNKKRLQYRRFPVNMDNLLRISILKKICEWLLLKGNSF